ncbi:hypothetical protein PFICI_14164 [Pestalotiopsis fici W106-1]|uniref:SUI1 domain-containing protein n=1 Tax=Pestalotiopsis fici (strain W106-1 / CGMCC3.15140) TaxID=1229662 RepID=W3WKB7_PESFW|nr:uncharacterized protein PFICI_14164 [Pestalotiopsis fici W106-1]ETS74298.1 hypothetical protein PFICI_14164 [Pestalotiopsis fici W106-1]
MASNESESRVISGIPFDPFTPPTIQIKVHKLRFTLVEGLDSNPYIDLKAVFKQMKKSLGCGGMIMNDPEVGESIVLSGDQRSKVERFLVDEEQGLGISHRFVKVVEAEASRGGGTPSPKLRKQKKIKSAMDLPELMRLNNI